MSRRFQNSKSIYALFIAAVILTMFNIQDFLLPIFASHGGQWARVRKGGAFGWGDLAFYPQTNLYPYDAVLYAFALLGLLWLWRKYLLNKKISNIPMLYLCAATLPFIWAAVAFAAGFNYDKCNIPSQYFACVNPTNRIVQRLLVHGLVVILTLLFLKIAANILTSKQKQG